MATTRLGLYGGPRSPYGSFVGKELEGFIPDVSVPEQFGKKFYGYATKDGYAVERERLSLQMRQEDEEILTLIQIIGKYLL